MPEYLAPGVYIEEVTFRARPIEGVSTSTAGFIGAADGPRLLSGITSFVDFEQQAISGSSYAYRYLPDSVLAFPDQRELVSLMQAVGFSDVRYYNLFGGVASLHIGDRQSDKL